MLYGIDDVENFEESGDAKHALDTLVDVCKRQASAVVAAIDFVTNDLAHSCGIDIGDGGHVEDGVAGE